MRKISILCQIGPFAAKRTSLFGRNLTVPGSLISRWNVYVWQPKSRTKRYANTLKVVIHVGVAAIRYSSSILNIQ
jgi:hypothetical protein